MTNPEQGYGGTDEGILLEEEPPPAVEDDWGLEQEEVDESVDSSSSRQA